MYIHANMPGSETMLIARDGVLVGMVVEADTCKGWVRYYDIHRFGRGTGNTADWNTEANADSRTAVYPIVYAEGEVDFVGDTATDPSWMIAQRLAAIRIKHGLPIDVSITHDTSSTMMAWVLERLAAQLRSGTMVAVNLGQSKVYDRFPLPNGKWQSQPTGRMNLSLDYESPSAAKMHETTKVDWACQYPELAADHVQDFAEEKTRVIEEIETATALRVRAPSQLRPRPR